MDAFKFLLPKGKKVDCLEDLGALTIKELKHILVQYREKTSGVKADLILRTYAVFCRAKNFNSQSNEISDESSLLCHENDFTFEAIYEQCKHLPWTADLRASLQSMALFDEISGVHEQKAWCAGAHHQKFLVCWCAPAIFPVVVKICKFAFYRKNAKASRAFFFCPPFLLCVWVIPIEAHYQCGRLNKD